MYAFYVAGEYAGSEPEYWSGSWEADGIPGRNAGRTLLLSTEYCELHRRLVPPARLLEAGCGHGLWVLRLAQKGYNIVGLDFSQPTIEALKTRHPNHRWVVGDVRRTDFPDASFDGVLSWGVIEHFENGCSDILIDSFRILRAGGYLFVTVPYLNAMRARMWGTDNGSNRGEVSPENARFFQYYLTKEELGNLVASAGFSIETYKTVQRYFIKRWTRQPMLRKAQILVNSLMGRLVSGEKANCMLLCVAQKPL